MIAVVEQSVRRVEAREAAEVIEFLRRSTQSRFVAPRAQVAGVSTVVQHRLQRRAARRCDVDHGSLRIRSVECAVRSAVYLDTSNPGARNSAVVERAANIFRGYSIDQYLVAV